MKKRSDEMQTLCAGCSKAEPTNFAPPQTPLPGGAGQPKYWLEMVTTFTYKPSLVRITQCYHGNRHTHTPTHPQTGPITIHCAAASVHPDNVLVREISTFTNSQ